MLEELVDLMDLYMKCRPHIVAQTDPGTLFLNRRGGALKAADLSNLVRNLSRRSGKSVVPGSVRDSFANYWPDKYPEDYDTLADILWMEIPAVKSRYAQAQVVVA